jgi:uncharacterized protein (TIGR02996 family)
VTEGEQLLRAVLEEPGDDTVRLVYADWLEEQGNRDDREQAEFIRVQMKIARMSPHDMICERKGTVLKHAGGKMMFEPRCRCGACSLARREYESSKRHLWIGWHKGLPAGSSALWNRGFVSEVRLSVLTADTR